MDFELAGFSIDLFGHEITISPWIILTVGLLLALYMGYYYFFRRRRVTAAIKYSDLRIVRRAARSGRTRLLPLIPLLRILAVMVLVVAFARPRSGTQYQEVTSEGIDIMLALDVSSSMQAEDFKPNNRLYVAKEEIKKFIERRLNDRIGLVVFAGFSFTQCPLTTDYGVLLDFVDDVDFGMVKDGTAIGMAIANGVNRLRESEAKSKIMILLTDGDNNMGEIDPITAANLAKAMGIKIYTIGAGRPGYALTPIPDPLFGKRYVNQPTKVDEKTLKEIASITGGKYFRARSGEELDEIYGLIDQMEKTKIEVAEHVRYRELFVYFTIAGLLLLALEVLLSNTLLRKLP